MRQPVRGGVRPRDLDGGGAAVGAKELAGAQFERQRDHDGSRAGADIGHPRAGADAIERRLDERLGLGARHQHPAIDPQPQGPELALPRDVRQRHASRPLAEKTLVPPRRFRIRRLAPPGQQRGPVETGGVLEQHAGLEPRRLDAGGGQPRSTPIDRTGDGLDHSPPPLRASDWKWAASASIISWMSPSMKLSSR